MRCTACGYYNLPGSTSCARCGRGAEAPAAAAGPSFSELYPPRARNRPAWVRLAETVREQVEALRARVPVAEIRRRWLQSVQTTLPLALGALSLVPGLGQLRQRRFGIGAAMLTGGMALAAGAILGLHHRVSDVLILLLFALVWYSVTDALLAGAPASGRKGNQQYRMLRYSFVAAALIAGSVAAFGLALTPWYSFWRMGSNGNVQGLPLRAGDGLIIRHVGRSPALRSGDVVLFRDRNGWGTVGTVCALAGQPVPASTIPVTEPLWNAGESGPELDLGNSDSPAVVPGGEVAVSVPVTWTGGNGRAIARVRMREMEGRIAGVYAPPERRRWYR